MSDADLGSAAGKAPVARRPWRPEPAEWIVLASIPAAWVFLRFSGARLGWDAAAHVLEATLRMLPGVVAAGIVVRVVAELARRRSPWPWLRAIATGPWLAGFVRAWAVLVGLVLTYTYLKVFVPLIRLRVFDAELWALDRWLHFGVSPTLFAVELLSGSALLPWIDFWYALWLTTVLVTQSVVLLSRRAEVRSSFVLACVILWLSAAVLYLLIPVVGPCYFVADAFAELRADLPHATGLQGRLWENYLRVVAARQGPLVGLLPFHAVAALPSVHVGAHWLFALFARRHARPLFVPLAVATVVTFLCSIVTGWHYAVDGYVGAALAWMSLRLAERWVRASGVPDGPRRGGASA